MRRTKRRVSVRLQVTRTSTTFLGSSSRMGAGFKKAHAAKPAQGSSSEMPERLRRLGVRSNGGRAPQAANRESDRGSVHFVICMSSNSPD